MKANYVSHFRKRVDPGQCGLALQIETAVVTSYAVASMEKMRVPKLKREKTKNFVAEVNGIYSQYTMNL